MAKGMQTGPRSSIVWTTDTLTPRMEALPAALDTAINAVMEYEANYVQNDARHNAPWTDRTGNARQGLFARTAHTPTKKVIVLYHTMPYGVWLELKNDGEYAIIMPTISADGPRVMKHVSKVMDTLA